MRSSTSLTQGTETATEVPASSAQASGEAERLRAALKAELVLANRLVTSSEGWVTELREKLGRLVRKSDALPSVSAFFAHWSLHLLRAIVNLIQSELFGAALLILRSVIEAHMELSFILHRDCGKRANEYLKASRENRAPYREQTGFESFGPLGKRAGSCGLGELYRKTYLSLSYYSHLRVKGSLAAEPNSVKSLTEATACLVVGQTMFAKIARQLSRAFGFPMPQSLARQYANALRRYKALVRGQEQEWAQDKSHSHPA